MRAGSIPRWLSPSLTRSGVRLHIMNLSIHDLPPILLGGALFGAGAAVLELVMGRTAGFCGIVGGALDRATRREAWRWWLLGGVVLAAGVGVALDPSSVVAHATRSWPVVAIAGVLVGYGTRVANGCTSGHGICGVSRGAPRSLAATATFLVVAFATFQTAHLVGGLR